MSTPLQGEFLHLMAALGAGIAAPLLYAALLVLPLVWWTDPRYIVPAVAAMLPPAISCASAGLAAVFSELLQGEPWLGRCGVRLISSDTACAGMSHDIQCAVLPTDGSLPCRT